MAGRHVNEFAPATTVTWWPILANARAVQAGDKTWDAQIDGTRWTQQTFPYQAKCLRWTNERYQALSESDRASVDALLEDTGVEIMLSRA